MTDGSWEFRQNPLSACDKALHSWNLNLWGFETEWLKVPLHRVTFMSAQERWLMGLRSWMESERQKHLRLINKQLGDSLLLHSRSEARNDEDYEGILGENSHVDQMKLVTVLTLLGFWVDERYLNNSHIEMGTNILEGYFQIHWKITKPNLFHNHSFLTQYFLSI